MPPWLQKAVLLFVALFTLYSPLASISSYFPIVATLQPAEQRKLALRLFRNVSIFVITAIWVGEPLLNLLGLTTAALTTTGGIALIFVGVPLMRGQYSETPIEKPESWKSLVFMPVTFPLTVGGTTFAILVSFRSLARSTGEVLALTVAGLAYAAVTALTVYASGHLERRVTPETRGLLERIAGILLTAIAVTLLTSGIPRLTVDALEKLRQESEQSP